MFIIKERSDQEVTYVYSTSDYHFADAAVLHPLVAGRASHQRAAAHLCPTVHAANLYIHDEVSGINQGQSSTTSLDAVEVDKLRNLQYTDM